MKLIYNKDNVLIIRADSNECSIDTLRNEVQALAKQLFNSEISHLKSGAPFLANNPDNIHISISHTTNYIVLYYSRAEPCGIDVECNQRNASKAIRKFTDEHEILIAQTVYPQNPALLVWCVKEALYKMCDNKGAELKKDFSITGIDGGQIQCTAIGRHINCRFFEFENLLIVNTLCQK